MGSRWSTKATQEAILEEARQGIEALRLQSIEPHLAVIIVGEHPASQVYVQHKVNACADLGVRSTRIQLPEDTGQAELLAQVEQLNNDHSVHGILVQLPLPKHIDANQVLWKIDPEKDVDGFHPINVGRLVLGQPGLFPCTPMGVLRLIQDTVSDLKGKHAVVVGRSAIVGKPMAHLLLHQHCSVTVIHSRTREPQSLSRLADILVVAVGRPGMVDGSWIKPGALVVDVGINEIRDDAMAVGLFSESSKRYRRFQERGRALVGDVDYRSALDVAGLVTPVPGGVGKLTIAQLMLNCVVAAQRGQHD